MRVHQTNEFLATAYGFRCVPKVAVNFQQVADVQPLAFGVARFPALAQSGTEGLLGLAYPAGMEEKFAETPVEKCFMRWYSRSAERLRSFDIPACLRDQRVIFQSIHPFPKLAVPVVPLDQRIVVASGAQRVPEL